jgi:ribonuclease HI
MTIVSDSQYVVNTIKQQWAQKWLREKDETKKNLDLWVKIVQLLEHHDVTIEWTKGHSVNKWNNLADLYAQHASQIINPIKDECEHCTKKIGQSLVSSD